MQKTTENPTATVEIEPYISEYKIGKKRRKKKVTY